MPEHNEDAPDAKPEEKKPVKEVVVPQVGEVTIPEEESPVRGGPPKKIHPRRPLPIVPSKEEGDNDPGDPSSGS